MTLMLAINDFMHFGGNTMKAAPLPHLHAKGKIRCWVSINWGKIAP